MSTWDEDKVQKLREDIQAESDAMPPSTSAEDNVMEIAAKHVLAQGGHKVWEPGQVLEFPSDVEVIPMNFGQLKGKAIKIIGEVMETGEPVFVLRAKDLIATLAVAEYIGLLERFGSGADDVVIGAHEQLEVMKAWQRANPEKVRYPD